MCACVSRGGGCSMRLNSHVGVCRKELFSSAACTPFRHASLITLFSGHGCGDGNGCVEKLSSPPRAAHGSVHFFFYFRHLQYVYTDNQITFALHLREHNVCNSSKSHNNICFKVRFIYVNYWKNNDVFLYIR